MIKVRQVIQLLSTEESKMSIDLINSVIDGDYVSANRLFEERLSDIQEKKLYEVKRMFAAELNEVLGGKTRAQAEKDIRARGMTPRRASDVYPDPRNIQIGKSKSKPKSTVTGADELGANLQKLRKQWKSASFRERKTALKKLPSLIKQYAGVSDSEKPEKPSTKPAAVAAPSVSDAGAERNKKAERNRQSWDKLKSSLAAKMDRKSAMEKKRKEFMKSRPLTVAKKIGMSYVPAAMGGIRKGAIGALSDIGSQLEE